MDILLGPFSCMTQTPTRRMVLFAFGFASKSHASLEVAEHDLITSVMIEKIPQRVIYLPSPFIVLAIINVPEKWHDNYSKGSVWTAGLCDGNHVLSNLSWCQAFVIIFFLGTQVVFSNPKNSNRMGWVLGHTSLAGSKSVTTLSIVVNEPACSKSWTHHRTFVPWICYSTGILPVRVTFGEKFTKAAGVRMPNDDNIIRTDLVIVSILNACRHLLGLKGNGIVARVKRSCLHGCYRANGGGCSRGHLS